VYRADPTVLSTYPGAIAVAIRVSVELTVTGPVYCVEEAVGALPLAV